MWKGDVSAIWLTTSGYLLSFLFPLPNHKNMLIDKEVKRDAMDVLKIF